MKISIAKAAFLFSAVIHGVMLNLVGIDTASVSGGNIPSEQKVIRALVLSGPRPFTTPNPKSHRAKTNAQSKKSQSVAPVLETLSSSFSEGAVPKGAPPGIPVLDSVEMDSNPPEQNEVSETPNVAGEKTETNIKQLFSICRGVTLPRTWVQSVKFFPRRYTLEFNIERQSEGVAFVVLNLTPEDSKLPYADRLIQRVFQDCMNKLGQDVLFALEERLLALNPEPIGAYSLKIEFDTALATAGQSKGI